TGQVNTIQVTNPGSGYAVAPAVSLSSGGGSGATAHAVLSSPAGSIVAVNLSSAGQRCYSAPSDVSVAFTGGGGSGAAATAVLESSPSCIYSVDVYPAPVCTNKLDAAHGYSPIDQASSLTLATGN